MSSLSSLSSISDWNCDLFFFQAEGGIRDLVRSRGLGDVYKRQATNSSLRSRRRRAANAPPPSPGPVPAGSKPVIKACLLYTSDAADERSSVDLGGRRIIKKKTSKKTQTTTDTTRERTINHTATRHHQKEESRRGGEQA